MKKKFYAYAMRGNSSLYLSIGIEIRMGHTPDEEKANQKRFQRLPQFDYEIDVPEEVTEKTEEK